MKQIFAIVLLTFIFTACKKDKVNTTEADLPSAAEKKLTSLVSNYSDGSSEFENYTYDVQGRISTINDGIYLESFDYKSPSQLIVTQKKVSNNEFHSIKECSLDAKGRVTMLIFKNAANTETGRYEYAYNSEGYIIVQKYLKPGNLNSHRTEYEIVNGNLVSSKSYADGVLNSTGEFKSDESKLNKSQISYAGYWNSNTLFGKPLKNLIIEYKSRNSAGTLTWHNQRTFVLSSEGYPVKYTINYPLTGFVENTTLTFE